MLFKFILFLCPILLMILGILIRSGKCPSLIAGFSSTPQELRNNYNEKELNKFLGRLLLYLACIQFIPISAEILNCLYIKEMLIASNIATIFIVITSIVNLNTAKHFKKED